MKIKIIISAGVLFYAIFYIVIYPRIITKWDSNTVITLPEKSEAEFKFLPAKSCVEFPDIDKKTWLIICEDE